MIKITLNEDFITKKSSFFAYGMPLHILFELFKDKQKYFCPLTCSACDYSGDVIEKSNSILIPRFNEIYPILIDIHMDNLTEVSSLMFKFLDKIKILGLTKYWALSPVLKTTFIIKSIDN